MLKKSEMLFLFIIIYKYNEHTDNLMMPGETFLEQTNEHATEELQQLN